MFLLRRSQIDRLWAQTAGNEVGYAAKSDPERQPGEYNKIEDGPGDAPQDPGGRARFLYFM